MIRAVTLSKHKDRQENSKEFGKLSKGDSFSVQSGYHFIRLGILPTILVVVRVL